MNGRVNGPSNRNPNERDDDRVDERVDERCARTRRWTHAIAIAVACGAAGTAMGCKSIPKLVADGRYDEAIDEAIGRRRPPRGRHARAYATALVQTGRWREARGVLFGDYQRGGELTSLLALADLERSEGLDGTAAVHYARIIDVDVGPVAGRDDVCVLLRSRADARARAGAGAAAQLDLDRAADVCGEPPDARGQRWLKDITARTRVAQQAEVDARVDATRCRTGEGGDPDDPGHCDDVATIEPEALAAALAQAQRDGPKAMRQVAAGYGLSLAPDRVVALLVADMRGELGTALLGDDEVRRWVGTAGWSDFAPLVMSRDKGEAAYLQLRLDAVLDDMPSTPDVRLGPRQREIWAAQATDAAGPPGWRIFAWLGDMASTELALSTAWRPRRGAGGGSGAESESGSGSGSASGSGSGSETESESGSGSEPGAESESGPEVPAHWSARLPRTVDAFEATLQIARLRWHRGGGDVALRIARYAVAQALEAEVPDAAPIAARFAGWHLAHGRYWQALAIADAAPHSLAPVAKAAATALRLAEALCGGACADDEDRAIVERNLGDAWVHSVRGSVAMRSAFEGVAPGDASRCPSPAERFVAGGPLAAVLAEPAEGAGETDDAAADAVADRTGGAGEVASGGASLGRAQALARIVESDVALGCAAADATLLWTSLAPSPTAESLAELLAHEPGAPAPDTLMTLARLAMLAGRDEQAENLAVAAGGSARDPRDAWRRLASFAHVTGQRDVKMMALRETLLHTPGLQAPAVREALLLEGLRDVTRSWGVTETPAGREALLAHVEAHLEPASADQRWLIRDALLWRVAAAPWWRSADRGADAGADPDGPWRPLLLEAVTGDADPEDHPLSMARLLGTDPPPMRSDFDLTALVLRAEAGELSAIPAATAVLDDPVRLAPLRLAIARHGRQWKARWRTAIGLAVYGGPRRRAEALAALLEMATPPQRAAILAVLVHEPAALEPEGEVRSVVAGDPAPGRRAGGVSAPIVDDAEVLLRLVAGLPLSPAWLGR